MDFFKQFPDEQSCRDYSREQRQEEGITCRNCKGTIHYWMKTIEQFQCKECGTRTTLRSGTVMGSSNLSFSDWFITQKIRVAMGARDERHEVSGFTEMDEGFFTIDGTLEINYLEDF